MVPLLFQHYGAIHFHEDDLYDCSWETDFDVTISGTMASGVCGVRLRCGGEQDIVPIYVLPRAGVTTAPLVFLAVLDLMCGGRLEVGIGPGGNLSAYDAFGLDSTERMALLVRHHRVLVDAWLGRALPGGDRRESTMESFSSSTRRWQTLMAGNLD